MATKIQIKSIDGNLLFEHEAENNSIKKTVEAAVKNGVKLVGADLSHANLSFAKLTGVVLRDANLRGVDWDTFHSAYQQAKSGNCPYKDKCKRYERTVKKRGHQLSIF